MIKNQRFNIHATKNRPRNKTKLIYVKLENYEESQFDHIIFYSNKYVH